MEVRVSPGALEHPAALAQAATVQTEQDGLGRREAEGTVHHLRLRREGIS
jgi:hypothetical protein